MYCSVGHGTAGTPGLVSEARALGQSQHLPRLAVWSVPLGEGRRAIPASIEAGPILFHCIFLKGCYDFLDVWWPAINQAFMMSCERPPPGLPPARQALRWATEDTTVLNPLLANTVWRQAVPAPPSPQKTASPFSESDVNSGILGCFIESPAHGDMGVNAGDSTEVIVRAS